jgi:hypothetical protein
MNANITIIMADRRITANGDSKDEYVMGAHEVELHRLGLQYTVLKDYMGMLALAPVDFT